MMELQRQNVMSTPVNYQPQQFVPYMWAKGNHSESVQSSILVHKLWSRAMYPPLQINEL